MRVLDLFSGIGGFSLGLERAGMETVAFCEIDPFCQKVLKKHWSDVPIYNDVTELTNERLKSDGINGIDVVTGGFPCQDISISGRLQGFDGERSSLWSELIRIVGEVRPSYAIFENVRNLLNGQQGDWFKRVLWEIYKIGYNVEWHCIPASSLGANHKRDRVWMVAYPDSTQCKGGGVPRRVFSKDTHIGCPGWWEVEPAVDRVANGIPNQSHRLRSIGNAVVPQIPEIIGLAILEHMEIQNEL